MNPTEYPEMADTTVYTPPKGNLDNDGAVLHDFTFEDFKASRVLEGLPPGVTADKMEFLEKEWSDWLAGDDSRVEFTSIEIAGSRKPKNGGVPVRYRGSAMLTRKHVIQLSEEGLRILRLEIRVLGHMVGSFLMDTRARDAQNDVGAAHIKHQQEMGEFHKFMMQHFEAQLDIGRARNQSLLDIAKGIMLEQKHKP
jgi:hypothetical protein